MNDAGSPPRPGAAVTPPGGALPDIGDLYRFASDAGSVYGTEDFCFFLYSVVKMHKPQRVLELGTGTGVSSFWIARALRENGSGTLLTIDDGRQWDKVRQAPGLERYGAQGYASHRDFILAMAERFGVARELSLVTTSLPPYPEFDPGIEVDLLFSDFRHDPATVLALLAHFLPRMSEASSIFIDSASTAFASYLLLERLIEEFNVGRVPKELLTRLPEERAQDLASAVRSRRFTLVHLTEVKDRDQNGTAWIKIAPIDIVPYPRTRMR